MSLRPAARLALLLGAAHAAPALAPVSAGAAWALRIPRDLRQEGAAPAGVALTFDDGPHPAGTPAVLDALARAGAPATFFLSGEQVRRRPALAAELAAAGHAIALHCDRHRCQLRLTPRAIAEDLRRGEAAIAEATGTSPRLYRPPYGVFSAIGLARARRRYRLLLWSRWGHDWRAGASPRGIAAEATAGVRAGDVILLHDADHYADPGSWRNTAAALPRILDAIAGAGLEPVLA